MTRLSSSITLILPCLKSSQHLRADVHKPFRQSSDFTGRSIPLPHIESEANTLENDVLMHQCIAESMQANQIGK
jgi:hypothetical protein